MKNQGKKQVLKSKVGIHWFRRDLRFYGNSALRKNWQVNEGKVVGLFCFDKKFLDRKDFSNNRFAFFLETLKSLKNDLKEMGSDLLVIDELPLEFFSKIKNYLNKNIELNLVTYNRDYEPFARNRDSELNDLFKASSIPFETFRDHLVFEPGEVVKEKNEPYQIYSPFARKWLEQLSTSDNHARVNPDFTGIKNLLKDKRPEKLFTLSCQEVFKPSLKDSLEDFLLENKKNVTIQIPKAGRSEVIRCLESFKSKIKKYSIDRDFPFEEGTSRVSTFLKNGSLTVPQVISYFKLQNDLNFKSENSQVKFLKELIWREFYYHILYFYPEVENQSFIPKFKNICWVNDKTMFQKWCDGMTGFPIVDAGMRELKSTGWMHNRVRMIVASFLTKDLLIDWRWGENYFMKYLLDGDLAPNNGGWQWAASTGCDPQPYFRIFNPWLQSKKFDPKGDYIRKYVPELRELGLKQIHEPHLSELKTGYPEPIVDHNLQRQKALTLYSVES